MKSLGLVQAFGPIILVLALALTVFSPALNASPIQAADQPAKGQGGDHRVDKQPDTGNKQEARSNPGQGEGKQDGGKNKSDGDETNKGGGAGSSPRPRPTARPDDSPQPRPTAAPAGSVSISGISVADACGAGGTISLSGPYYGTLTLMLTYHVTGSSQFTPTGSTWTHTFSGETSAAYSLPLALPPDATSRSGERVNSFRVEVASADPAIGNMTAKSQSFYCEGQTVPTVTPTQTTVAVVPSATAVPVPAETSTATPMPAETITATPMPAETSTATPMPSAGTGTDAPTGTPSVAPTVTPTPTATQLPADGMTRISPDNAARADPSTTVSYIHTVFNLGQSADTKEIAATSSQGWPIGLFAADGTTPLIDTNGNGLVDTSPIPAGQSREIVVKVTVPAEALMNTLDVTTVTAISASSRVAANAVDSATDTTTVNGVISVALSTSIVSFGQVSPIGAVDPGAVGVSGTADSLGAYYVKSEALQVTVSSNAAWTGTVQAQENSGTAGTIRILDGDLQWRLAGDPNWTALSTGPASPFATGSSGVSSYQYDYRLRVLWMDAPGTFNSIITYDVTQ